MTAATVGVLLAASPAATATPTRAIGQFTTAPARAMPTDALGGERSALASDQLLLSDPGTGLYLNRATEDDGTTLDTPANGDEPVPWGPGRDRLTAASVSAAGTITAPFAQRVLSLSLVKGGSSETGPMLQLTSPSDQAEYDNGYTTLAAPVTMPELGQTYLLRTAVILPNVDPNATAGLASTPEYSSATNLSPVDGTSPSIAQQWTLVGNGVIDAETHHPQFQLVNRSDGTCLSAQSPDYAAQLSLCDGRSPSQLWTVADLSAADGGGTGIRNVGSGLLLRAYDASYWNGIGWAATPSTAGGVTASWQWQQVQQHSPIPQSVSFATDDRTDVPFDLAVGDVDGVRTDDVRRDEAVVAYGRAGTLVVSVVDYNSTAGMPGLAAVTTMTLPMSLGDVASGGKYGAVNVNTADLDGDGVDEIIVSYVAADKTVDAVALRYTHADSGAGVLTEIGSPQHLGFSSLVSTGDSVYPADAAVADLDGDGVQEIAWAGADGTRSADPSVWISAVSVSGTTFTAQWRATAHVGAQPLRPSPGHNTFIRIADGRFQPATTGSGTRQLAVSWATGTAATGGSSFYNILRLSHDGNTRTVASLLPGGSTGIPSNPNALAVTMAVGGFTAAGGTDGDNPNWGIALSIIGDPLTADIFNGVTMIQPTVGGGAPAYVTRVVKPTSDPSLVFSGYELVAWDPPGDSLMLDNPIVFTVQKLTNIDLVGAEPPTHSDWVGGAFLNISRNQDFALQLGSSDTSSFDNETSQESNQSFGMSVSADISTTLKTGVPLIGDVAFTGSIAGKLDASWKDLSTFTSGYGATQTAAVTQKTQDDDIVNATVQDLQVYRYPVWSTLTWDQADPDSASACHSGCFGYWDVVVPGSVHQYNGFGKADAFFQPPWQNGNALSYPALVGGQVPITDAGPYSYVDANGVTQESSAPLVDVESTVGGGEQTVSLDVSKSTAGSTAQKSEHGWNINLDFSGSATAEAKVPGERGSQVSLSLAGGFNPASTFVGSTTGKTTSSHDSTFLLQIPEVASNRGYDIGTTYYYDSSGTPRVAHGVNLTGDNESAGWWRQQYGAAPDPALNLPDATVLDYGPNNYLKDIFWNPDATRQLIRGFSARRPVSGDPTTSGAPYGVAAQPGDPVVFDVDVANDSLTRLTTPLTVDFDAVPVDSTGKVTGSTVHIDTATVASMQPQQHVTVSSAPWTAIGGPSGTVQRWRIFVTLDKQNNIDEVHEWAGDGTDTCPVDSIQSPNSAPNTAPLVDPMTGHTETLACGQNNQGFAPFTVAPTTTADDLDQTPASFTGAGVRTQFAATQQLTTRSAVPVVRTGSPTQITLHATADRDSRAYRTVIVYDGPPAQGHTVAMVQLQGLFHGQTTSTSFSYTPPSDGTHVLYAQMLGPDGGHGMTIELDATKTGTASGTASTHPTAPTHPAHPTHPSTQTAAGSAHGGGALPGTGGDATLALWLAGAGLVMVAAGALLRRRHSSRARPRRR
ncbi:RICIN domain-containing protein [Microbacterium sp.]|uniref:RICIN domain-containing protein n=1 Tax=Microbacterium sp. TaxID=51671 RepID=UPI003A8FB053